MGVDGQRGGGGGPKARPAACMRACMREVEGSGVEDEDGEVLCMLQGPKCVSSKL